MLCKGLRHHLVLNKISKWQFDFKVSLQFLSELNNISYVKDLKIFTFYVKLIDDWKKEIPRKILYHLF